MALVVRNENGLVLQFDRVGKSIIVRHGTEVWDMSPDSLSDVLNSASEVIGWRDRVVAIASAEVGKNDLVRYWCKAYGSFNQGFAKLAWCGVFALYCLREAELTDAHWIIGKGFISPLKLKKTTNPERGDIAYFNKNQHHAIVLDKRKILGDEFVVLANGNGDGGRVSVSTIKLAAVTAFYSIQRLIDAK